MTVLRNIRLALTTVIEHAGEDPALLLTQVLRRLPSRLAAKVSRLVGVAPSPVLKALAAHLSGDRQELERILAEPHDRFTPRSAARLADIALAASDPVRADELLLRAGDAPEVRARRRWYDGDMSGAITVLLSAGRTRQARRLEGELRVFEGWAPRLGIVRGYRPERRTVLHLLTNSLPHTGSGYAQRSHSILRSEVDGGWKVHAATRLGYPVQIGRLFSPDREVRDGVVYHRLLPRRIPPGFDERLQVQAEMLLALALRLRPSVLHTTSHFVNAVVVREVARALGIPWVYEVRGQLMDTWASTRPETARTSQRYRLFTDREARVMLDADLVVTLGHAMLQGILSTGVRSENTLLAPNGVGEEYLDEPLNPPEARRRLGLPEQGTFVGTVSSLIAYEGLDDLLRAVAACLPALPGMTCLIVGDGAARPSLVNLAEELGIADHVIFTGRVPREEARMYHMALDVFVVPRKDLAVTRSVTPLKPVEAMACARPVIASDLPALRELIEDRVSGLLVTPDQPLALAAGLTEAVLDPALRSRLGRQGRALALSSRTWAQNAERYLTAYDRLEEGR